MSTAGDGRLDGAPKCPARRWDAVSPPWASPDTPPASSETTDCAPPIPFPLDLISVADFNASQDAASPASELPPMAPAPEEKKDGAPPTAAHGPPIVDQQSIPRPTESHLGVAKSATDEDVEWPREVRGWLMVVAVQIAAATYQAGINPPGGLWQDDKKPHVAGQPVARDKDPWFYGMFKLMNLVAFLHSLAVIVLLMKRDVYLRRQHVMVTLRALVISAAASMAVAFIYSYRPQWPNGTTFLRQGILYVYSAGLLVVFIFWRRLPVGERLPSLAWAAARLATLVPFAVILCLHPSFPSALLLMICWCVLVYQWI